MRIALATLATAILAALALLALAAFNLHVFVDAHRSELVKRAERALRRSVTIGAVTASWSPIGIRFADVVVAEDARFGTAPFLEAAAVRIAVRPWQLVLGKVEVSEVTLDKPRISFVRDAAGRWNVASFGGREPARSSPEEGKHAAPRREMRLPLVLLGFSASQIRDGRIELEDRSGPVPRRLSAVHVRVRASELRLGRDVQVRLDAALFPGSTHADSHLDLQVPAVGTNDEAHAPFTAHLEVDDADLGTLAAAAGRTEPWSGRVASIVADASGTLERLRVDLAARGEGGWRLGPHLPLPRLAMRLDTSVEITRDTVRLAHASGAFGTLEWRAGGTATLRPWALDLTVQSVPESVLIVSAGGGRPPLRLSALDVALRADDALHLGPARARIGDVDVEATARLAGLDPLIADGRVHASGFSGVLDAVVDADSAANANVRVDATGVDLGAAATRLSARPPPITGRADLSAAASVPWNAARPLHALSATGTIRLTDGSVAVVNVAERVLRRMPALRFVPQLVSARTRARFPEVFEAPGTGLETATVPFTVADGIVSIPRLAVSATSYLIKGEATVDAAQAMRFRGDLVLSPELSSALRADFPALRYLARPDGQLVVPFRMSGRLDAPMPEPELKRVRGLDLEALVPGAAGDGPAVERLERLIRP